MAKKKGKRESVKKKRSQSGDITFGEGGINFGGDNVEISIGGDVSGGNQQKVGGDITGRDKVTSSGLKGDELAGLFQQLRTATMQAAPPKKQAEAQEKIAELQAQLKAKTPDVGVVGKSLKWLKKNVPGVSGALNTVLSQPIIGQSIKDIAAVILEDE